MPASACAAASGDTARYRHAADENIFPVASFGDQRWPLLCSGTMRVAAHPRAQVGHRMFEGHVHAALLHLLVDESLHTGLIMSHHLIPAKKQCIIQEFGLSYDEICKRDSPVGAHLPANLSA